MRFSGMVHLCHSLLHHSLSQLKPHPFQSNWKVCLFQPFLLFSSFSKLVANFLLLAWKQLSNSWERLMSMSPLVIRNEQMKVRIKIDWDASNSVSQSSDTGLRRVTWGRLRSCPAFKSSFVIYQLCNLRGLQPLYSSVFSTTKQEQ